MMSRRLSPSVRVAFTVALCIAFVACAPKKKGRERAVDADVRPTRDIPRVLDGTVGAMSRMDGLDPEIVSGYGLVVGLAGTGSRDVPIGVRSLMEREMLRQGVGRELGSLAHTTPDKMLDDPNTAVVFVQALVPPGAPVGAVFDVRVSAVPGTGTTSLQGGRLYTCELRRGIANPSAPDTMPIAVAKGPLFINPFTDPAVTDDTVKTRGRILGGGTVITPFKPTLTLDTPSHARARQVVRAINSRFPHSGSRDETARGLSDELIAITIPQSYKGKTDDFVQLLSHVQVNLAAPQEYAVIYTRTLREQPSLATELAWCLEALGEASVTQVRDMYTEPEIVPRMTALQVGARLGDAATSPHLRDVAQTGSGALRTGAIRLLGLLPPDPQINLLLRELLDNDDLAIRVAAYRALLERADVSIRRLRLGEVCEVHVVPAKSHMIFFSQSEKPTLVIFGANLAIERPMLASAWDNRLVMTADYADEPIRILYRDHRSNERIRTEAPADLVEFITFCAHTPTPENPEPGLALGYSQIVGVLHALTTQGAVKAILQPERDVREAEYLKRAQEAMPSERPELAAGDPTSNLFMPLVDPPELPMEDPNVRVEPGAAEGAGDSGEPAPTWLKRPGSGTRPEDSGERPEGSEDAGGDGAAGESEPSGGA